MNTFLQSDRAATFVEKVDTAFLVILGISFFFLISITAVMIYFIIRYRHYKNPKATQIKGSTTLEIIWTIIPTLLALLMFYFGWAGWRPMTKIPKEGFEVEVIARMWNFSFKYPNGKITDSLYVPTNQPVILNLRSLDVIHSLYIPAFRLKQDMVPGKENQKAWFEALKPGTYDLFCTEYCGLQHSYMYSGVRAMPSEAFEEWYKDTAQMMVPGGEGAPGMQGLQVIRKNGCTACHSLNGQKLVGPSFKGLFGRKEIVLAGKEEQEILADEAYILESIYEPSAKIVKGYQKGLMAPYRDLITEEEIQHVIDYLKQLN